MAAAGKRRAKRGNPEVERMYKGVLLLKDEHTGRFRTTLDRDVAFRTLKGAKAFIDRMEADNRRRSRGNPMGTLSYQKAGRAILKKKDALQKQWKAAHYSGKPTELIEQKLNALDQELKQLRQNPADASVAAFEEFHGHRPDETVTVSKQVHFHKHLAGAGQLRKLVVKGVDHQIHSINGFKGALLAFNEQKNQLFIEGGDQSINLKDFGITEPHEIETLGKVMDLDYFTDKHHLGSEGGKAVYAHRFRTTNQDGQHVTVTIARYPDLIYRVRDEQLEFSGGSYQIKAEGIDR